MSLSALLLFASALFLAAGSPGPSVAALVARVLTRGYRDVLPFIAAMWIGEAIWLCCAVGGLSVIASSFQPLFAAIKWIGIAYLLYLAWKMWFGEENLPQDTALPHRRSGFNMFLTGLALTLGNPKIMVFYAALLPSLIDLSSVGWLGLGELLIVMLAVLAFVDLAWVFFASKARRLLRSTRSVRLANRASATSMAGAAAVLAVRS